MFRLIEILRLDLYAQTNDDTALSQKKVKLLIIEICEILTFCVGNLFNESKVFDNIERYYNFLSKNENRVFVYLL